MTSSHDHPSSSTKNASKAWIAIAGVLLIGLIAGVGAFVGTRFADDQEVATLPIELQAATSASNESLSMATGLITSEVEGLWLLDHESGKLQCWVLSPRNGSVAGIFVTNVLQDLESNKGKPEFVMTTGNFFFSGGKVANLTPAASVCYIANTTSGVVAGYSVRVNATLLTRGASQSGELVKVCTGKIKEPTATRDQ